MLERLLHRDATRRVEDEHSRQQADRFGVGVGELVLEVGGGSVWQAEHEASRSVGHDKGNPEARDETGEAQSGTWIL